MPAGVDAAYSTIQQSTIEHYALLKAQARTRITDEDALNAELVSLDRQRNAELQDNHREYLQTLATQAKDLLGERAEAFREESDAILHNWDRTVAEFERRLREADTEDAIQQIQGEFTEAQEQMLASLNSVLIELGFTAEQAAEIMTGVFRTAETESDGFADKVISAFKRLGRESDRETKRQNREIERSYRELTRDIENILGSITDFFIDIANDGDIEQAFKDLGSRIGNAVLDEFQEAVAGEIASTITGEVTAGTGTGGGTGAGAVGFGSGLASLGATLLPMIPILTAISATALLIYGTVQKIQTRSENAGRGEGAPSRRPDPEAEGGVPSRRPGASADEGGVPSRRPVGQQNAIEEIDTTLEDNLTVARGISDSILQRTAQIVDAFDVSDAVALQIATLEFNAQGTLNALDLERILEPNLSRIEDAFDTAAETLRNATGDEIEPAFQDYITATNAFFDAQIADIRRIGALTGQSVFEIQKEVAEVGAERQDVLNQERASQASPVSSERLPGTRFNASLGGFEQIPSVVDDPATAIGSEQGAPQADPETVAEDALAEVIQAINEDVALINASITSVQTQVAQANDPEAIAALLDQLPELISEKYSRLREALDAEYSAGEITVDAYNASITELNTSEAAELERNSDEQLANTLQINQEAVEAIATSISGLENAIAQSNDPAEIETYSSKSRHRYPKYIDFAAKVYNRNMTKAR